MAAIDKIYGTKEQYKQLIKFLEEYEEVYEEFTLEKPRIYEYDDIDSCSGDIPIVNLPIIGDTWLALNCKFPFVEERLREIHGLEEKDIDNKQFKKIMMDNAIEDSKQNFLRTTIENERNKKEFLRNVDLMKKQK